MGRRRGLKIPRALCLCEFESRLRHQQNQSTYPGVQASWPEPFMFLGEAPCEAFKGSLTILGGWPAQAPQWPINKPGENKENKKFDYALSSDICAKAG